MATKAAIAFGDVDASAVSATENLTSSGFGTVDAAVFVTTTAGPGNNPSDAGALSVGFWDGTSAVSWGILSLNNISSSMLASRGSHIDSAIALPNPNIEDSVIEATVSGTTDGVVITTSVDNTSSDKRIAALLLGGLTNAKAFAYQLGTGTSYDITSIGFKPDVVFIGTVGFPTSGSIKERAEAIFSFGVVHNNSSDTVTQGLIAVTDKNGVGTTVSSSYADHQYCAMQLFDDAVSWKASAGSFDSSGFTLTTTASPGSDQVFILALQLADPDDFAIVFDDMPTSSGSDSVTGLAFEPDAIGLLISQATANQTVTAGLAAMVGFADASVETSLYAHSEDNQGTSDAHSGYSASNVIDFKSQSGAAAGTASLTSLNSDGWTLNYSTGGSAARKIVAFAVGNSVGGGTNYDETVAQAVTSSASFVETYTAPAYSETLSRSVTSSAAFAETYIAPAYSESVAQSVASAAAFAETYGAPAYAETLSQPVASSASFVETYEFGANYQETIGQAVASATSFAETYTAPSYNETIAVSVTSAAGFVEVWQVVYTETIAQAVTSTASFVEAFASGADYYETLLQSVASAAAFAETYGAPAYSEMLASSVTASAAFADTFATPAALPTIVELTATALPGYAAASLPGYSARSLSKEV